METALKIINLILFKMTGETIEQEDLKFLYSNYAEIMKTVDKYLDFFVVRIALVVLYRKLEKKYGPIPQVETARKTKVKKAA